MSDSQCQTWWTWSKSHCRFIFCPKVCQITHIASPNTSPNVLAIRTCHVKQHQVNVPHRIHGSPIAQWWWKSHLAAERLESQLSEHVRDPGHGLSEVWHHNGWKNSGKSQRISKSQGLFPSKVVWPDLGGEENLFSWHLKKGSSFKQPALVFVDLLGGFNPSFIPK